MINTGFLLEVCSVSGSNYQIGFQVGERFRTQIANALLESRKLKDLKRAERGCLRYRKLEEYGSRYFPQYMEEIRGIAEGSGLNLRDLLLINFHYDFPQGCTTVVLREPERVILAHNEDNSGNYVNNCYILQVFPEGGTPFISFCYPGMLPGNAFAFNSYGMVITTNAMRASDVEFGIPRHLIDRSLLGANNISHMVKKILLLQRASGGSFNVVSRNENRAINVETTSKKHCITEIEERYFHTNHYISRDLNGFVQPELVSKSSMSRYDVGAKLVAEIKEKSPQVALDILSRSVTSPYSIPKSDASESVCTLCTSLFDISCDGITMKIYESKPNMQENDAALTFTLDQLEEMRKK